MKHTCLNRVLSVALAILMALTVLPMPAIVAWAQGNTYVLDVSSDMLPFAPGTYGNGASDKFGTDGYFILHYGEKMKLDTSNKTFSDGVTATHRINFQSKTDTSDWSYSLQFTCTSAATVKIWWVAGGDARRMTLFDSNANIVAAEGEDATKNSLYISTFEVGQAGTYYIGSLDGSNYIFRVEVTESEAGGEASRTPWADVAAPAITEAVDHGNGEIVVEVNADVSNSGGDKLTVTMCDQGWLILESKTSVSGSSHTFTFKPSHSGTYHFYADLSRDGEEKKTSEIARISFVLPLEAPILASATNKGNGAVELVWGAVAEAERYDVYRDGKLVGDTTETSFLVEGCAVGATCNFYVTAVRGENSKDSNRLSVQITQDSQRTWGFTVYGPSTNQDNNGYVGDLNADGFVTVYSENGRGKIVPASTDGLAFYYTAIPTAYNFTLRATVTVDSWTLSNGQEGFGLMVADRLGESGNSGALWNNQYMALCSKIEYRYEGEEVVTSGGTKYSMKMGLGVIAKTGVTQENLSRLEASDTETINKEFSSVTNTLEWAAGEWEKEAGTYNIVGNYTEMPQGTLEHVLKTTFHLEIQKNNTGYFVTYYAEDGTVLCRQKYYDPDALSKLDTEYVYAGFFAARNARVTFSDVELTTILASEDAPAEEKPVIKIVPEVSVSSGNVTTSGQYELFVDTNVSGKLQILVDEKLVLADVDVIGGQRYRTNLTLADYGEHRIRVGFQADPEQDLGENVVLSTTAEVFANIHVTYNRGNYHSKVIFVSPEGLPNGNGSREYPFDIYTAVANVVPGQTIVLMEGVYKLTDTVRIQRGMDGTEENPIRMIADPQATTRPVLDFQRQCAGIVHGGDYWYFYGFDVTNTADAMKGFQVSGNYNVLDQIQAYWNGSTGIQISRYSGKDLYEDWPMHNLVLNCTAYCNYDKGFEDADGFAAKLTVGEGNVFDGCVAYNNADDGWDLYAKKETGSIGAVTIRNCVAYANGFIPGMDGKGNGNGFKLGGESLSGKHVLENSYAFFNLSKGIDSNSCPDVIVKNCVSYNNGSYNVAFYTNDAANTDFAASGILSFRDSTSPYDYTNNDNLKGKGTQDDSKYLGASNYYWQGSVCVNAAGEQITAEQFVSLTFPGQIARNADGTIAMQGFLELKSTGTYMGGVASEDNSVLPEDGKHNFAANWDNLDPYYHWHLCECGARADLQAHSFTWIIDWEPTETTTGQKHEECTECGYKRAAITTYYEQKDPAPTEPAPTQPDAGDDVDEQPDNTVLIVVIVVVAATAAVLAVFVIKKKK